VLVTFRREDESILIGEDIEIFILDIRRSKVKLGVKAPRHIVITTREMQLVREQNLAAAQPRSDAVLHSLVAKFLENKSGVK
jgi:carbon storage regulator